MAINFSGVKSVKLKVKLPNGDSVNKDVAKIAVKNGPVLWQASGTTINVDPYIHNPGELSYDPIESLLD